MFKTMKEDIYGIQQQVTTTDFQDHYLAHART